MNTLICRAYSNLRQGSLPEGSLLLDRSSYGSSSLTGGGLTRPTSETNLRQLAYGDSLPMAARPGSAMGLLQGSSIVNANGMRCSAYNVNARTAGVAAVGLGYGNAMGLASAPAFQQHQVNSFIHYLFPNSINRLDYQN